MNNAEDIIRSIYLLLLNRQPEAAEIAEVNKALAEPEAGGKFLLALADCEERKKLVKDRKIYIARAPFAPLITMLRFVGALGEAAATIRAIIVEEYALSMGLKQLAVTVQKKSDNYLSLTQTLRMLQIASRVNYIDYVWITQRSRSVHWNAIQAVWPSSEYLPIYHSMNDGVKDNKAIKDMFMNVTLTADVHAQELYENSLCYTKSDIINKIKLNCELRNMPAYARSQVVELFADIFADPIADSLAAPRELNNDLEPEHVNQAKIVSVSGFWLSGSSAIYDYLRSSSECGEAFPPYAWPYGADQIGYNLESTLFSRHPDNLHDLFLSFKSNLHLVQNKLTRFLLMHMLSFVFPHDEHTSSIKHSRSLLYPFLKSHKLFSIYMEIIRRFIQQLRSINHNNTEQFTLPVMRLITDIAKVLERKTYYKYILLDNAINAPDINASVTLDNDSIILMVYRDPRDQYISLNKIGFDIDRFIKMRTAHLRQCLEYKSKYNNNKRIIAISFEHFVQNEMCRRNLCDALAITFMKTSHFFNPDYSKTRIGKYLKFNDQKAISRIESTFPDLIDHSFAKHFEEYL